MKKVSVNLNKGLAEFVEFEKQKKVATPQEIAKGVTNSGITLEVIEVTAVGSLVEGKDGRLVFEIRDTDQRYVCLENAPLEKLERSEGHKDELTLTGRVTLYKGKGYFLIKSESKADEAKGEPVTLTGIITIKDDRPIFSVSAEPAPIHRGDPSYTLLENEWVEKLLEKGSNRAVTLKGSVTQYKGKPYLFIDEIQKSGK
ncbi:hypothetical protein HYR99_25160 [Candidatus Poribacteria bacterium]|nr:hypothetical protein [Candidatus Poribacteria bacterium]